MAVVAGTGGAVSAYVLLKLIALFTNLAYFQRTLAVMRPFPDASAALDHRRSR